MKTKFLITGVYDSYYKFHKAVMIVDTLERAKEIQTLLNEALGRLPEEEFMTYQYFKEMEPYLFEIDPAGWVYPRTEKDVVSMLGTDIEEFVPAAQFPDEYIIEVVDYEGAAKCKT